MTQLPISEEQAREMFQKIYPLNIDAFDDLVNFERNFSPTVDYGAIFHYTSVETCKIILNKCTVRFTNITLLNDSQEYLHSLEILQRIIEGVVGRSPEESVLNDYLRNIYRAVEKTPPMYVACFSRDYDKLSQWRGYTPKASGACVAFDSLNLTNSGLEYMPLYDVIYDGDRQINLITDILGIVGEQYFRNKGADNLHKIMDSIVIIAIRQLQIILTVTKSHFWQEENEIRWILDLIASKNLRHLIYNMPTTVDIKIDHASPIPILGVTLGPSSNTDDRVKDINSLLDSKAFKAKILHFSNIPLRY